MATRTKTNGNKPKLLASSATSQGTLRLVDQHDDFIVMLVQRDIVQWRVHHRISATRTRAACHKAAKHYYDNELARLS